MNSEDMQRRRLIQSNAWAAGIFTVFLVLAVGRCFANLPWLDEGFFYDPVYNWLVHGHTGTTVVESKGFDWEGIERYQFWQPPLHLVLDAAWMKIFGLSLVSFRGLSVMAGLVALSCWWWLMRYFALPRTLQMMALTLIATDYAFVRAASDGRTDMLAQMFGISSVVAYLHFRERNFWKAVFVSQFLVVCGGLTHPMGGVLYLPILFYLLAYLGDWRKVSVGHVVVGLIPYLLGVVGWGLYISQDFATFRKIFFGSSAAGRMNGIFNLVQALQGEIRGRYLLPNGWAATDMVTRMKLLIPAVYFSSALLALLTPVRKLPYVKPFLAMLGIEFVVLLLLDNQRNGTYLPHVAPLYMTLLAAGLGWVWEHARVLRIPVALMVVAFVAVQAGGSAYLIQKNPNQNDYGRAVEFVQQQAKPGDRIVAAPQFGFGLGFDRIRDDQALGYFVGRKKPDVLILDVYMKQYLATVRDPAIQQYLAEVMSELTLVFETPSYKIYMSKKPHA